MSDEDFVFSFDGVGFLDFDCAVSAFSFDGFDFTFAVTSLFGVLFDFK